MANNPEITTNTFSKGMLKDYNETFIGEGLYTHARNTVNNSHDGQIGVIGNEPSNIKCVQLPYTLIGSIPLIDDQWVVFTTNDVNSEIGYFQEGICQYHTIVNDSCLSLPYNLVIYTDEDSLPLIQQIRPKYLEDKISKADDKNKFCVN